MFRKFLVWLLLGRDQNVTSAVRIGKKLFIVKIEEFVPLDVEMTQWESALGTSNTQSATEPS